MPRRRVTELYLMIGRLAICGTVNDLAMVGATKVVQKGGADRLFINTSGVGVIAQGVDISGANARPGDAVILSGTIGDHGIAVLSAREDLGFETELQSDLAPLNHGDAQDSNWRHATAGHAGGRDAAEDLLSHPPRNPRTHFLPFYHAGQGIITRPAQYPSP